MKKNGDTRENLLRKIWEAQDRAYDLMVEYDSLPHNYGDNILYQAEGHAIDMIAGHPGITVTDMSNILKKTVSACSQIVRKLREKGWVEQYRNKGNNRQYNLAITESGMEVYLAHQKFVDGCKDATYSMLEDFTEDELLCALNVQLKLNQAYEYDVQRSRSEFTK